MLLSYEFLFDEIIINLYLGGRSSYPSPKDYSCPVPEDRLYNPLSASHPRISLLKNTNVESEMSSRRAGGLTHHAHQRRVHYSDADRWQ